MRKCFLLILNKKNLSNQRWKKMNAYFAVQGTCVSWYQNNWKFKRLLSAIEESCEAMQERSAVGCCLRVCVCVWCHSEACSGVSIRSGGRLLWAMGKQLRGTGECVTEASRRLLSPSPTCPIFPSTSCQNTVGQEFIRVHERKATAALEKKNTKRNLVLLIFLRTNNLRIHHKPRISKELSGEIQ